MCIYCFMFFANELSLAVYFICILDYGNVRQKGKLIVTSHNDPIYGIKHYMFMLYSLDMASGTVL